MCSLCRFKIGCCPHLAEQGICAAFMAELPDFSLLATKLLQQAGLESKAESIEEALNLAEKLSNRPGSCTFASRGTL